ncbi:hypothetical protein EHQ53_12590 [Leptospira langatensis]|uniref:Nitroreductase n=2 Tax=Leptospira langatensis TaxID=2484983 RepID=A0A5F1ZTU5_9LEPT|nr:hypothetical protein EHO57_05520 [Leptospira langatensis]TGL40268.1 hypothetical protein EHQ53_12590 [Leptospira langatensis]
MNFMTRKKFLKVSIASGLVLTVPQFLQYCSGAETRKDYERPDPLDPILLSGPASPILKAIRIGISAPNPHNIQPWKFKILNDESALLYVDETRLLKETDPPFRQVHIGQGTFLEVLSLGATRLGYKAEISLFPEGKYTTKDIGKKPIAKIILRKQDAIVTEPISGFISERATKRSIYEGEDLTEQDFSAIRKDANIRYSELGFIPKSQSEVLRKQVISAMEVETYTYPKYEESRIWFRYNDSEMEKFKDGISMRGFGVSGLRNLVARNFFLTPGKETWHSDANKKSGMDIFASQVESSKGFAFIKTAKNEPLDWVQAGRDYARLHLSVTKNGFAMHPLSQILQEFPEMNELRTKFESSLKPGEKIQMLVRLGRSDYRFFSPRRDVEDFILR